MAQSLARHSDINLTMNVYTDVVLEDQAVAVELLPQLPDSIAGKQEAVFTLTYSCRLISAMLAHAASHHCTREVGVMIDVTFNAGVYQASVSVRRSTTDGGKDLTLYIESLTFLD